MARIPARCRQIGSGLHIATGANVTLDRVQLSGNHAPQHDGAIWNDGMLILNDSSITGNAANTADVSDPNCASGVTSQGHNQIDDVRGCPVTVQAASDILGQDPHLAPLDLNDGDIMTPGLIGGSPAIDHGACVLAADQRGVLRPQDGDLDQAAACNIGADEFVPIMIFMPIVRTRANRTAG